MFQSLAKAEGAALVPFMLAGVADSPEAAALFQDDRIHPNAQGAHRSSSTTCGRCCARSSSLDALTARVGSAHLLAALAALLLRDARTRASGARPRCTSRCASRCCICGVRLRHRGARCGCRHGGTRRWRRHRSARRRGGLHLRARRLAHLRARRGRRALRLGRARSGDAPRVPGSARGAPRAAMAAASARGRLQLRQRLGAHLRRHRALRLPRDRRRPHRARDLLARLSCHRGRRRCGCAAPAGGRMPGGACPDAPQATARRCDRRCCCPSARRWSAPRRAAARADATAGC